MEAHAEDEDILVELIKVFPDFETILSEEIISFKEDSEKILG